MRSEVQGEKKKTTHTRTAACYTCQFRTASPKHLSRGSPLKHQFERHGSVSVTISHSPNQTAQKAILTFRFLCGALLPEKSNPSFEAGAATLPNPQRLIWSFLPAISSSGFCKNHLIALLAPVALLCISVVYPAADLLQPCHRQGR